MGKLTYGSQDPPGGGLCVSAIRFTGGRNHLSKMGYLDREMHHGEFSWKGLLGLLFILFIFFLGVWAANDGAKPHPERPEPTGKEWLDQP